MKIRGSLKVHRLFPASVLRIRGEDAPIFLQGQFSKDLRGIAAGEARYGLWLTVKGKVLADSYIVKQGGEGFLVVSLRSAAVVLRQRLEDFIIADDVTVEDETERWMVDLVLGEGAGGAFPEGIEGATPLGYPGRDDVAAWLRPRGAPPAALPPLDADGFEALRIEAGLLEIPRDLGPGELPHEGGLESLAISYDKGCYLGQEIMARLKTRGRVRRRVVRVRGAGEMPGLPASLSLNGKPAGELRSAVRKGDGFEGLALLPADAAEGLRYAVSGSAATVELA